MRHLAGGDHFSIADSPPQPISRSAVWDPLREQWRLHTLRPGMFLACPNLEVSRGKLYYRVFNVINDLLTGDVQVGLQWLPPSLGVASLYTYESLDSLNDRGALLVALPTSISDIHPQFL